MIKDILEQAEALEQRIHTLSLTKEEMDEVYNYGIDLFFNTEAFLD